jgi:Tol biopolymer transport system component
MLRACLAFLLVALFFSPLAQAGIGDGFGLSPFWHWKQIETEHFRITFPEELGKTAERAANYLEDAHSVLSKMLYWEASYKTSILLIDNADSANGVTSALERFGIVLFATPPDNWFSTAYYEDWLRLLCFHEYTHFLNMDATRGVWAPLRILFGDVLLPTAAWPSWMLEGLAVYVETRYTHEGRGRSPYYDMILRSAAEAQVLDTDKFFTLDRFNGAGVPYFPGGEDVYLFGYQLMNEVAANNHAGPTADGEGKLSSGQDALGLMSYRSSWRLPWFINGNLENITGRDWYSYWDQFVQEAKDHAAKELAIIRTNPVSQFRSVETGELNLLGSAFSPDGRWLAYTGETLDDRAGLFLKDLKTGETRRVQDKIAGAQMAFTPDSRFLILSSLRREAEYLTYSEIGAYSIAKNSIDWLTSQRRARDPDVSRDGKSVVFTIVDGPKTSLARATLTESGEEGKDAKASLKDIEVLVPSQDFDVVSEPKFSADGTTVYFSLHRNGKVSEELMALDLSTKAVRTLVENGHFNRFPAVNSRGELYFVSDLTGVDNLYQYREGATPLLTTNLTTGMAFPSFTHKDELYGAVLSYRGWALASIDPLPSPVSAEAVTIPPPSAPAPDADSETKPATHQYEIEDYSVTPSIWPRTWVPYAYVAPSNFSFGDVVTGYDAVDRHEYLVNLGYDTLSRAADWAAEYQNRSLGATVSLLAANQFSYATYSGTSVAYFARDEVYSLGVSFQNFWTYSSLTPSLALTFDRTSYFNQGISSPFLQTQFLPDLDLFLSYSNLASSPASIGPESGHQFLLGARYYINNGYHTAAAKGLVGDVAYFRLGRSHAVLSPSLAASFTSANPKTNFNLNSDVILQGYYPLVFAGPVLGGIMGYPSTSLTRMPLRGYPYVEFFEKAVVTPSLDFRFPISDVFRGWGTNPLFLERIYGTAFVTAAYLPYHQAGIFPVLPAAGGGLTADLQALFQVPMYLSAQYQYGFQKANYGVGDAIIDIGYSGLGF